MIWKGHEIKPGTKFRLTRRFPAAFSAGWSDHFIATVTVDRVTRAGIVYATGFVSAVTESGSATFSGEIPLDVKLHRVADPGAEGVLVERTHTARDPWIVREVLGSAGG